MGAVRGAGTPRVPAGPHARLRVAGQYSGTDALTRPSFASDADISALLVSSLRPHDPEDARVTTTAFHTDATEYAPVTPEQLTAVVLPEAELLVAEHDAEPLSPSAFREALRERLLRRSSPIAVTQREAHAMLLRLVAEHRAEITEMFTIRACSAV
jgi:hypothetical protein